MSEPRCISTLPAVGPEPSTDHPACIPAVSLEPSAKRQDSGKVIEPDLASKLKPNNHPVSIDQRISNFTLGNHKPSIDLTIDQLKEFIRQAIKDRLPPVSQSAWSIKLYTYQETAKQLGISTRALTYYRNQGVIKCYTIASRRLYQEQDIQAFSNYLKKEKRKLKKGHRYCSIPERLDLDKHIEKSPPNEINGFCPDKLSYLVSKIASPEFKKNKRVDPWINLHSLILKRFVHNYKEYIEYLIRIKVIERKDNYSPKNQTKRYKITKEYISKNLFHEITDKTLLKKLEEAKHQPILERSKVKEKQLEQDKKDPSIQRQKKFLESEDLVMDEQVLIWIEEKFETDKEISLHQYNHYRRVYLDWFEKIIINITRDLTSRRLHSLYVRTPKEMKKFISDKGQPLIEMDKINSQPFMSLPILTKPFWEGKKEISISNKAIRSDIINKAIVTPFMLPEFDNSIDINFYNFLVLNNKLYDWIALLAQKELPTAGGKRYDREFGKKAIFNMFFAGNNYVTRYTSLSQAFQKKLPSVYSVFIHIKSNNFRVLSHLLQSIESHLILDLVLPKIPLHIPVLTVHDSIVTTLEHQEEVYSIMHRTIMEATGFIPTIRIKKII